MHYTVFAVVLSVVFLTTPSYSKANSEQQYPVCPTKPCPTPDLSELNSALDIKDAYDELRFIDLQVAAVAVDMSLPLGWQPDNKKLIHEASLKAISDLEEQKKYLKTLEFPEELKKFRQFYLEFITKLRNLYNSVELRDTGKTGNAFRELWKTRSEIGTSAAKMMSERYYKKLLPSISKNFKHFKQATVELQLISDKSDKKLYRMALRFIDDGQCWHAYNILAGNLYDKYQGTVFGDCVSLRMSDCLEVTDTDIPHDADIGLDKMGLVADILNSKRYSPVLYEAYYKWRTLQQKYEHGPSNWSDIPNKEYNQKRHEVLMVIKEYFKQNPDDMWAWYQIDQLIVLNNIVRGGTFGNSSILDWAQLYTKILQDRKKIPWGIVLKKIRAWHDAAIEGVVTSIKNRLSSTG